MTSTAAPRRRRAGRRTSLLGLGIVVLVTMAGCAASPPEPTPEAAPAVAPPAVTVAQSENVLDQVGAALAAGDAALDPSLLTDRVSGPALAIRTAEYVRATATGGAKTPTVLPTVAQALVVPDTDVWPRTQLVVTEQPEDLQAPRLLVLRQDSAREPYRLWGWARLGPSVTMPPTADPATGSLPLAADDASLLVTPADAMSQYADVLANGDASAYAATFPADFFRTSVENARGAVQASFQPVGTVTETYTPVEGEVMALATVDGGAIVVGQMSTVTTVAIAQGSIALSDPFEAALAGRDSVSSSLVRTYSDVIALYVPPKDSATPQVQVLAVEHAITSVTGE
ncbi:hypothetical protein AGMMS50218_10770 [Actinomycetota bacterium]|nr:hypothetical protein AGMMS50218_10770 [Actinomycetota bacterium]